ncbi:MULTISPECIES: nitroreductase family protein [Tenacibaculum]|uniref:Nitroreductase n=1 Tax=Tenacibaculum mesophilum TaxID=104268 RepID=A0AAE9MQF5_9FLAO|nr:MULTISPECIES: nitroreductase [Tenacibaculum]GFD75997.1 nitroreductase [Tenacibaculum sp. KUL113]GFD83222.1 nitroreductase [Tenacibaculum sp. KUL118]GFD93931.1 nitroreductase [Alteromonas sp. KUL154]GFD98195.1 nitroreductase [Alteromonas sp. KUL156]KAF9660212.1 nitroreductase [Tenacibaculum mesophilum]
MKKFLFLALSIALFSCEEKPVEKTTYSGSQREAIIDNILTRRSIRKYTDQQVSKAQLDTVMKSALFAPSALNKQPWEVRVIQNQELLTEINNRFLNYAQGKEFQGSAARYREPGFSIFHSAPTLIVIARNKSSNISYLDSGIILQNILLSAHAIDLGTCPLGTLVPILNLEENKDILELLNIPEGFEVAINVALGYPDEQPVAPKRYPDRIKIIE